LRLLVDEDTQAKTLVQMLKDAGHDVLTAATAGLGSMDDAAVLAVALETGRVLLTRNCGDFAALHSENREHPGILAVYQDADRTKNLSHAHIVTAIGKLERAGVSLAADFVALNAWR